MFAAMAFVVWTIAAVLDFTNLSDHTANHFVGGMICVGLALLATHIVLRDTGRRPH